MRMRDRALYLRHPRWVAAFYFGLLALIGSGIIDSLLTALLLHETLVPTHLTMILATILAFAYGAIFGEQILHSYAPYRLRVFLLGFTMTLAALPVFALFYLVLLVNQQHQAFVDATAGELFVTYFIALFELFLFAGFWLAILAGLAAVYLRSRIVYDILHTHNPHTHGEHAHHPYHRHFLLYSTHHKKR